MKNWFNELLIFQPFLGPVHPESLSRPKITFCFIVILVSTNVTVSSNIGFNNVD